MSSEYPSLFRMFFLLSLWLGSMVDIAYRLGADEPGAALRAH
jgi:hypothetical protein